MSTTAVDTSVLIAGLCAWHEAHAESLRALGSAQQADEFVIPGPALIEAYSVMTRLPSPHRLSPLDAQALLSRSFEGRAAVINLNAAETWRVIREAAARGIAGGAMYDAVILACAAKARAEHLLTLDVSDFARLAPEDIEIVRPR